MALRCSGNESANRYAASSVHRRSPVRPATSADAIAATDSASDDAYTSVSVAFCQTDDIVPATSAAANACQTELDVRMPRASPSRSEEHTSELQSPYVISHAVFCLKKR